MFPKASCNSITDAAMIRWTNFEYSVVDENWPADATEQDNLVGRIVCNEWRLT